MSFNGLVCNNLDARVNINTPNTNSNNVNAFNVNTITINGSPYPPSTGGISITELESGTSLPINFTPTLSGTVASLNASNGLAYNAQNGSLQVNNIDFDLNPVNAGYMGIYTEGFGSDILIRNQSNNAVNIATGNGNIIQQQYNTTMNAPSFYLNDTASSNFIQSDEYGIRLSSTNGLNISNGSDQIFSDGSVFFIRTPNPFTLSGGTYYLCDTTDGNTISSDGTGVNITSTNGFSMTNGSDSLVSGGGTFQMMSPNPIGITGTGVLIANGTNGDAIVTNVAGISITTTVGLTIEPPAGVGSAGMVLTNLGAGACAWQNLPGTSFETSAPVTDNTGSYSIEKLIKEIEELKKEIAELKEKLGKIDFVLV